MNFINNMLNLNSSSRTVTGLTIRNQSRFLATSDMKSELTDALIIISVRVVPYKIITLDVQTLDSNGALLLNFPVT